MKRTVLLFVIFAGLLFAGCSHSMHITNTNDYFAPPVAASPQAIKLGVTSSSIGDPQNSRYISAVVDALQRNSSIELVIYPYNQATHKGKVDAVVDISVNPRYSGSGSNFFVNFPGFLIFAPAIWGYGYNADIDTQAMVTSQKDGQSRQIAIPMSYHFRQAGMNRTWTEVSWFEVGVIALVGGVVFTGYDTNVTGEFIQNVSPSYGPYVAKKIVETACDCLSSPKPPDSTNHAAGTSGASMATGQNPRQ